MMANDGPMPADVRMVAPTSDAALTQMEQWWDSKCVNGDTFDTQDLLYVRALLIDVRASHANERHLRAVVARREAEVTRLHHEVADLRKDLAVHWQRDHND